MSREYDRSRTDFGFDSEPGRRNEYGQPFDHGTPGKRTITGMILRSAAGAAPDTEGVAEIAARGLTGTPQEIPHRADMERAFRRSFADVRAFTDSPARESVRALHAHAYTVGNDIAFATESPDRRLVAHELAHVVQHHGTCDAPAKKAEAPEAGDPKEIEADRAEETIVAEHVLPPPQGEGRASTPQPALATATEVATSVVTLGAPAPSDATDLRSIPNYGAVVRMQWLSRNGVPAAFTALQIVDMRYPEWKSMLNQLWIWGKQLDSAIGVGRPDHVEATDQRALRKSMVPGSDARTSTTRVFEAAHRVEKALLDIKRSMERAALLEERLGAEQLDLDALLDLDKVRANKADIAKLQARKAALQARRTLLGKIIDGAKKLIVEISSLTPPEMMLKAGAFLGGKIEKFLYSHTIAPVLHELKQPFTSGREIESIDHRVEELERENERLENRSLDKKLAAAKLHVASVETELAQEIRSAAEYQAELEDAETDLARNLRDMQVNVDEATQANGGSAVFKEIEDEYVVAEQTELLAPQARAMKAELDGFLTQVHLSVAYDQDDPPEKYAQSPEDARTYRMFVGQGLTMLQLRLQREVGIVGWAEAMAEMAKGRSRTRYSEAMGTLEGAVDRTNFRGPK